MPRTQTPGLRLEPMEGRLTPADVAVLSAQLYTPTTVSFTFLTTGDPGPFEVGVYRSADAVFDASDLRVTSRVVSIASAPSGTIGAVALPGEMPIDPARPHVLVVADPNDALAEDDEGNNLGSFRKLALGVVTHGFQPGGVIASWVQSTADALLAKGYAAALAYDWASDSLKQVSGMTVLHGSIMAGQIRVVADAIGTLPTDVVDVHLIGHSRGAVVISQAAQSLSAGPGPRELQLGYLKTTFLDPHPARNRASLYTGLAELYNGTGVSTVGGFSFDPGSSLARSTAVAQLQFQAAVNDPRVAIPANVDAAESIYQRLPWYVPTTPLEQATRFNFWADRPDEIANPYGRPFTALNLATVPGAETVGHTAVQLWYLGQLLAP